MTILAIDTSTAQGSFALSENGKVMHSRTFNGHQRHSKILFPLLQELNIHQIPIHRIIVGLGPGSFSGIRVAISAALAISAVKQAELWGICSAVSVAAQFHEAESLGVFADARRGEFYLTSFRRGRLEESPRIIPGGEILRFAASFQQAVSAENLPGISTPAFPRAADFFVVEESHPSWVREGNLEPIYLRTPVS